MDAVNSNITLIQTRTNIDVFMFEMSLRDFRILCGKIVNWRKSSPANFWYSLLLYFLHDIYNLFKISAQCSLHLFVQCGKGEFRLFYAMNSTLKSLHSPLPHCSIGILDFTFFEKILDVYENSKSQNTGFLWKYLSKY